MTSRSRASLYYLPRSPGARLAIGVLSLPTCLVFTAFLLATPYYAGPIKGVGDACTRILVGELLGLGAFFTLLAFIWAVATPRWAGRLLRARIRGLFIVTGVYLFCAVGGALYCSITAKQHGALLLAFFGTLTGIVILVKAPPSPPRD